MATLTPAQAELFTEANYAVLTTLRADGRSLVEEGVDVPLAKPFTTEVLHVRTE